MTCFPTFGSKYDIQIAHITFSFVMTLSISHCFSLFFLYGLILRDLDLVVAWAVGIACDSKFIQFVNYDTHEFCSVVG